MRSCRRPRSVALEAVRPDREVGDAEAGLSATHGRRSDDRGAVAEGHEPGRCPCAGGDGGGDGDELTGHDAIGRRRSGRGGGEGGDGLGQAGARARAERTVTRVGGGDDVAPAVERARREGGVTADDRSRSDVGGPVEELHRARRGFPRRWSPSR